MTDGKRTGWSFKYPQDGDGLEPGEEWENSPYLQIGWHAGNDLEQGTLIVSMTVNADEVLRAAEEITRIRADHPVKDWDFSAGSLTRPEAQKLIRVAKRARDQVFGADE